MNVNFRFGFTKTLLLRC